MKIAQMTAAALMAVAATQSFAVTTSESFDQPSSTYSFSALQIGAADTSFTFTLDTADGVNAGVYNILGDISGTNFALTSVTLNGQNWSLFKDADDKYRFGSIAVSAETALVVQITGQKLGGAAGNGNFQGSLVLSPVPEPATYAMFLGGLLAGAAFIRSRGNR
jgi:hypothetical protein